ncbi:MAG: FAD/NAD(P)-binding protein [Propionicimonas sp.]|uniref:FAD/NAD(P)-binding protein n=1 Tax=Propionicimonas sp. TaxID=1955623 RepID=UPI002B21A539|nr:FAD/NAD(P)-binding protein [Propionicimonas sp.]MEA4945765.1 FAD/NAD(P)-binding protein [Propionicimonas sp.]
MNPRRVAIVGAGPSGLFAAQALLARAPFEVGIDIFDRLPSPFGLLRYGVAPDHASIKAIATVLARVFDDPRVRFFGLVELGRDVTVAELTASYDAVVYAAGASEDRRMEIPGETLLGSHSAREFVAWYSGHPDASPQSLRGVRTAVTVGVGNVAIDVARVLLKPAGDLAATDMPQAVLDELRAAQIQDVWVIGRRGPEHASFTTPELRELLALPGVAVDVQGVELASIDDADLDRRTKANVAALLESTTPPAGPRPGTHDGDGSDSGQDGARPRARLHFLFWHRPVRIVGAGQVEHVVCERTAPAGPGRVEGVGDLVTIDAQLVLRAIGYRGIPIPGVPFDAETGRIFNQDGRVTDPDGTVHPGEYAVGWIKRGPIGVIGTNKADAGQTVGLILDDLAAAPEREERDLIALLAARGFSPSTLADWRRIDTAELARGEAGGRERAKIEAWHELLDLVRTGRAGGPPSVADQRV